MTNFDFNPLLWCRIFAAVAIIFQTIELLTLRSVFNDTGIWRWEILKKDFAETPRIMRWILNATLPYRNFLVLLVLRLVAAVCTFVFVDFSVLLFLFLSTLLISIRWRGTFNGGSDYMTIVVLFSLTLAELFPQYPIVALGCLYYIAIQSCLSYFISGLVKLNSPNWRSGGALHAFMTSGPYKMPRFFLTVLRRPSTAIPISWSLIAFESAFPLALMNRTLGIAFIAAALMFHLTNAYLLGLSRFLFIWAATYPVILWCSGL